MMVVFHRCRSITSVLYFRNHVMDRFPLHGLGSIHFIEIVLYELNGGVEVRLIEFVGDVPAEWTEFASLLNDGMQKCDGIKQRTPFLVRIRFQLLFLSETGECSLQTCFDA